MGQPNKAVSPTAMPFNTAPAANAPATPAPAGYNPGPTTPYNSQTPAAYAPQPPTAPGSGTDVAEGIFAPFMLGNKGGPLGSGYATDNQPQPLAPEFQGVVNPITGQLNTQDTINPVAGPNATSALTGQGMTGLAGTPYANGLQGILSGINNNTQVLGNLNSMANNFTSNPGQVSPWGEALLSKNTMQTAQNADAASQLAGSGTANAEGAMAARGGLSQGAAENLERGGANAGMQGRQGAYMQGAQTAQGIQANDYQQQMGLAEQIPGMQAASLQPAIQTAGMWGEAANAANAQQQQLGLAEQQYGTGVQATNVANTIGNTNALNSYNMQNYGNQMAGYAAGQSATATANSSKK